MAMRIVLAFSTAVISRSSDVCDGVQCQMSRPIAATGLLTIKHTVSKGHATTKKSTSSISEPVVHEIEHASEPQVPADGLCLGDANTYATVWGKCDSYAPGMSLHFWCNYDVDGTGVLATNVCAQCGTCTIPPAPVCTNVAGAVSTTYPCTCGQTTAATKECTDGQWCTAYSDTDGVCAAAPTPEPTEAPTPDPTEATVPCQLVQNAAISGYNDEILQYQTVESCTQACRAASWGCKSFDWERADNNECFLSSKSASDVGGLKTDYEGNPYDHYICEDAKDLKVECPGLCRSGRYSNDPCTKCVSAYGWCGSSGAYCSNGGTKCDSC